MRLLHRFVYTCWRFTILANLRLQFTLAVTQFKIKTRKPDH